MPALRTFIFWTCPNEWWSRIIVRITGRRLPDKSDAWSHMGIGFDLSDGRMIYYEALLHYGFTGPHPIEKLKEFSNSKRGKLAVEFLPAAAISNDLRPCGPSASEQILRRCRSWTHYKKSYYAWQLVLMWAYERFGRKLGWRIPRSPGKVVCSEAAACLLWPYVDLRDPDHPDFDSVNPNSAWRVLQAIKQKVNP